MATRQPRGPSGAGELVCPLPDRTEVILFDRPLREGTNQSVGVLAHPRVGLIIGLELGRKDGPHEVLVLTGSGYGWCFWSEVCVVESSFL